MEHLDHLQPSRVDPRKQALLEARFFARDKVNLNIFLCRVRQLKLLNSYVYDLFENITHYDSLTFERIALLTANRGTA